MNDLEVSQQCAIVKKLARKLDEIQANGSELALSDALGKIEEATRKAQWRLLEIKPLPPLVFHPSKGAVSG